MRKLRKALYVVSIRSLFGFPWRAVLLLVKDKFSAQPGIFCLTACKEPEGSMRPEWVSVVPPSVQIKLRPMNPSINGRLYNFRVRRNLTYSKVRFCR